MTVDRIAALRREAAVWFDLPEAELALKIAASVREDGIWNWLDWARQEWQFGWPQDVAAKSAAFGIDSVLDFGCGVGEVALHLNAQLDVEVRFVDLPGNAREFLAWRIGRRLSSTLSRPISPDELFALPKAETYDAVLCLEVMEHIPDAPEVLRRLMARAAKAFCITGVNGRLEDDQDPLHVYRESLLPVFEEEGWKLASGGGMPWWFVRPGFAEERGIELITSDGRPAGKEVPGNGD